MAKDRFRERLARLDEESPLTAFNVAAVAEAMDTVRKLKGGVAGRRTVRKRGGDWKSWDPEVFGVDTLTESGYIKRLTELDRPIILLSEEAERVEINLDRQGDPLYGISDPFDGSWLFKRQLPIWWYTSLALYAHDFTPVSAAAGDVLQNSISYADERTAYVATIRGGQVVNRQRLDEDYRCRNVGKPPEDLQNAYVASHGLKTGKFLKPLLERYGNVICAFKLLYPTGGPIGFVEVALGRIDVYFAVNQPYMDLFSSLPIALNAGAVVTDFEGRPFRLQNDDHRAVYNVVAGRNERIHAQVMEKLATCR